MLADGSASDGTYAGVAPAATLYFQSLLDPRGGLGGLPVSLEDLFEPAYQAGARVHNNSWGAATASAYTVDSNDVDAYAAKRRDMLIVIAAGNEGTAADPFNSEPGFVDWLSIGSPASCKNALTVGAARNRRQRPAGSLDAHTGRPGGRTFPSRRSRTNGCPATRSAWRRSAAADRVTTGGSSPTSSRRGRTSSPPGPTSRRTTTSGGWSTTIPPTPTWAGPAWPARWWPAVRRSSASTSSTNVSPRRVLPCSRRRSSTVPAGSPAPDSVADREARPNFHQGFGAVNLTTSRAQPGGAGSATGVRGLLGDAEPPARRDRRAAEVPGRRRSRHAAAAVHGLHRPARPVAAKRPQRDGAGPDRRRRSPGTPGCRRSPGPTSTTTSR